MFDFFAPSHLLVVGLVALIVVGPKDLPLVMRHVGRWVGKARAMARSFRSGFDEMVREAELQEMEKKWAEENERIMREHAAIAPPLAAQPETREAAPAPGDHPYAPAETSAAPLSPAPVAPTPQP